MRIGELAAAAGTTTKTLRFYESMELLSEPGRRSNGYRDYGPDAVVRVEFIRRAKAAGLTLAQVGEILRIRDAGREPCEHVVALLDARLTALDEQIAVLAAMRETVAALRSRAAAADPADCGAEEVCSLL